MAGAATSNAEDLSFAEEIGDFFASPSQSDVQVRVGSYTQAGSLLLSEIEPRIAQYLGVEAPPIRGTARHKLARDVGEILKSIELTSAYGVPTLAGMDNGFDLNPVVNVLDRYTLDRLELGDAPGTFFRRPRYSPSMAERNSRIELTDQRTARRSLVTLLTDALRYLGRGPRGGHPGYFSFTVYTTKPDYVLDSTPEWVVDYTRFGSTKTFPVTGNLRSGRYYFRGQNGPLIEEDKTLVAVGPANTSTHLNW